MKRYLYLILVIALYSCKSESSMDESKKNPKEEAIHKHKSANEHMNNHSSFEELVANFEDKKRIEWQKPEEVLNLLGDIEGNTILDIGCGTGYFAFRMVNRGANVICADIDDRFLEYVNKKKLEYGVTDQRLSTLKSTESSSSVGETMIDKAIIVNTYHHIENRTKYFRNLKRSMKMGNELIVIDFKKDLEMDFGPPNSMRLSAEVVIEEMKAAGFNKHSVNTNLLPYQYILRFWEEEPETFVSPD